MSQLPVPSPAPLPAAPVSTLDAADATLDRFLARVAALTPTQWGELDAVGQRLGARDPISRWRSVRRALAPTDAAPLLRDALAVVGVVTGAVADAVAFLVGPAPARRHWLPAPVHAPPEARRLLRALGELWDIAAAQPGGPGAAESCLSLALVALAIRPRITPAAFAEMYEPVEPIIPAASLR